jgi:hypothetical protein
MITRDGYSDDVSILPEGIVITFSKEMMFQKGGPKRFLQHFNNTMSTGDHVWMQKCKNAPTRDIAHVYIIIMNRLYCKGYFAGYQPGGEQIINTSSYYSFSNYESISWPRIIIGGPIEHCPFKRTLKGFQGFRYCTKLF